MESANIIFNQCRFCLNVVEQMSCFSLFDDSENTNLYEIVQKLLSIEFTAENSLVCGDCFSMWRMIQDYLLCCVNAQQIVLTTKELVIRKPWLENDEQKRMLIDVCRAVKKLYHELDTLKTRSKKSTKGQRKRKISLMNLNCNEKVQKIANNASSHIIKEEDPVEIDDSAAFQSDKPIEATRTVDSSTKDSVSLENEDSTLAVDDSLTIVEPQIEQVDLIDSSSEEDEFPVEYLIDSTRMDRNSKVYDENILKTVCQLCGITTSEMANHLESHIRETDKNSESENQPTESDCSSCSNSNSSSGKKLKQSRQQPSSISTNKSSNQDYALDVSSNLSVEPLNPLKCGVCGVEFASLLTARLHARLHPVYKAHSPVKSKRAFGNVTR